MVGSHWSKEAVSRGWKTYGIDRVTSPEKCAQLGAESIYQVDILDNSALEEVFFEVQPHLIIHLAAQSFSAASWKMEELTHNTNYLGTLKILQTSRKIAPKAKVLLAGTSVVYGVVRPSDCPLTENLPMRPVTPYGVTKAGAEHLGFQYFKNYNLQVFLPRFFNLLGSGHSPGTAVQAFARQLARIAKGLQEPILRVGNLQAARDFLDIRDAIHAMITLIDRGSPGVPTNICSGRPVSIQAVLNQLIDLSKLEVRVENDTALMRPSDEPLLYGDPSKLESLGWQPKHSLPETLQSIYNDWLERVESEPEGR